MTKKDIVRAISEEVGLTQEQTRVIVQRTFDSIIETLIKDKRIELRNFGVFEVKSRAQRKARNPKTGQEVMVPQRCVVTFKPGKVMEAEIAKLQVDDDHPASPNNHQGVVTNARPHASSSSDGRWSST